MIILSYRATDLFETGEGGHDQIDKKNNLMIFLKICILMLQYNLFKPFIPTVLATVITQTHVGFSSRQIQKVHYRDIKRNSYSQKYSSSYSHRSSYSKRILRHEQEQRSVGINSTLIITLGL